MCYADATPRILCRLLGSGSCTTTAMRAGRRAFTCDTHTIGCRAHMMLRDDRRPPAARVHRRHQRWPSPGPAQLQHSAQQLRQDRKVHIPSCLHRLTPAAAAHTRSALSLNVSSSNCGLISGDVPRAVWINLAFEIGCDLNIPILAASFYQIFKN